MVTNDDVLEVARWSDVDKAALRWLARATPVPVTFGSFDDNSAGEYHEGEDAIMLLSPATLARDVECALKADPGATFISFLGALAHEAAHSTKHKSRLHRCDITEPTPSALVHFLAAVEESTADCAAMMLAMRLGFDPGDGLALRDAHTAEHAPAWVRPIFEAEALVAVRWLEAWAEANRVRPFDDDLAGLVAAVDGLRTAA